MFLVIYPYTTLDRTIAFIMIAIFSLIILLAILSIISRISKSFYETLVGSFSFRMFILLSDIEILFVIAFCVMAIWVSGVGVLF